MMASYEEAKRANVIEAASKAAEMESVSEGGSGTIVAKQSPEATAGLFSSWTGLAGSSKRSSPQSPRGGKWVDVPQCPAVESCLTLTKLPLPSPPSLETKSTKPSEKTDPGRTGSAERGEKSKHGEEKEADHFLRPSPAPPALPGPPDSPGQPGPPGQPGGSKKTAGSNKRSKRERKCGTARPDPFWNEQVDWTPGLAFKYTLPQTDLLEVPHCIFILT